MDRPAKGEAVPMSPASPSNSLPKNVLGKTTHIAFQTKPEGEQEEGDAELDTSMDWLPTVSTDRM